MDATGGMAEEIGAELESPGTVTAGPEERATDDEPAVLLGGVAWVDGAAHEVSSAQPSTAATATAVAMNGRRTLMSPTVPAIGHYC